MNEQIGGILKHHRKRKNITLKELCDLTGLSVSYLSMLERGLNSPTVANLNLICKALDMTMAELIQKLDTSQIVVHRDERETIFRNDGYLYESATKGTRPLSCVVMTISDALVHESTPHVADEVGYVISGSLAMNVNGQDYTLEVGDSIYIAANSYHSYRKTSKCDCVSVWVYGTSHTPVPYIQEKH